MVRLTSVKSLMRRQMHVNHLLIKPLSDLFNCQMCSLQQISSLNRPSRRQVQRLGKRQGDLQFEKYPDSWSRLSSLSSNTWNVAAAKSSDQRRHLFSAKSSGRHPRPPQSSVTSRYQNLDQEQSFQFAKKTNKPRASFTLIRIKRHAFCILRKKSFQRSNLQKNLIN